MSKRFVAINAETYNDKLVLLVTSDGDYILDETGLEFENSARFLFNQVYKRNKSESVTFVCFAAARDNEFIFSTLPGELRDKLFQAPLLAKECDTLRLEQETLIETIHRSKDSDMRERARFEYDVLSAALRQRRDVKYCGYDIELINGKTLTLRKNGRSVSVYDVYGFFKKPLREITKAWLKLDIPILDRKVFNNLTLSGLLPIDRLYARSVIEAQAVAQVTAKLDQSLRKRGISLTRYHGASSITSHWLNKIDAKGDFYNYRYRHQMSPQLWKAGKQAYYGGRAEQLQLGTFRDVFIYDINSAYAYACSFLPKMLRKPFYRQEWNDAPFSVWFCDYDFRNTNNSIGLLPNRELSGAVKYKLKGSGYFWQPEMSFILSHYPECVKIRGGFIWDYVPANFSLGIEHLYRLRQQLQKENHPLEKVIKLALAAIYGKFKQETGKSPFFNIFYAGFITSLTRMMLLQAAYKNDDKIICFQTDAIHSTAPLNVPLNNNWGAYKVKYIDKVQYIDNGVYQKIRRGKVIGVKTRGFRELDFKQALSEIKDKRTYTAVLDFFVGHNLIQQNMFSGKMEYLQNFRQDKTMQPTSHDYLAMRLFDAIGADFSKDMITSRPVKHFSGLESMPYNRAGYSVADVAKDSIEAGRV